MGRLLYERLSVNVNCHVLKRVFQISIPIGNNQLQLESASYSSSNGLLITVHDLFLMQLLLFISSETSVPSIFLYSFHLVTVLQLESL